MAAERKIGDITVNNGGGLLDSDGMIDAMKATLNKAVSDMSNGQYLCFCEGISNVAQMMVRLGEGIRNERNSLKDQIRDLEKRNIEMAEQLSGLPAVQEQEETV